MGPFVIFDRTAIFFEILACLLEDRSIFHNLAKLIGNKDVDKVRKLTSH